MRSVGRPAPAEASRRACRVGGAGGILRRIRWLGLGAGGGSRPYRGSLFGGCSTALARVPKTSLLYGISGKLGPFVLRQVGGQTVVQAAEAPGRRAPRSPAQQAHLDRMYQAQRYAKAQIRDPAAKARYATRIDQRRRSAYAVAIADYMHAPRVTAIDSRDYQGRSGDQIRVVATDDFAVVAVQVHLYAPTGALLEGGPAALLPTGEWSYLALQMAPAGPGTRIEAEAHDYPGNVGRLELVLGPHSC